MFPGLGGNPRQMAEMMRQMGFKSEELEAKRVVIELQDGSKLLVEDAQVMQVEMQGKKSFQVSGSVRKEAGSEKNSGSGDGDENASDDVEIIMAQTGASKEQAREALEKSGGDIAGAILLLKKE